MSGNTVVSQSNNLSSGKTFPDTDSKAEIKEKIYELKYSDPNLAISVCLNALEENIPLGPNLFSLYLYSTLGELYLKKNLPVLALSYLQDAMYEYELIKREGIKFSNSQPTQQPWLTLNIGNIFFQQGEFDKAEERYKYSLNYFYEIDSLLPKIRGLSTTTVSYTHLTLPTKA